MDIAQTPAEQQETPVAAESDNTHLEAYYFYQQDPALVWLADKLRLNEYMIAGIAIITSVVILFGLGALFHLFTTNYVIRSLLQAFVIFPILAFICVRIPREIANLFNTFSDNKVIGEPRSERNGPTSYGRFIELLIAYVDNMWWSIAALVIVILFWLYRLLLIEPTLTTSVEQAQFWFRIALLALYSIMIYSITLAAVRLVVTLIFTNILFRSFKIIVNPLHPDGSAGLGMMGRMLAISAGFVTSLGAAAIVMNSAFIAPVVSISITNPSLALWEAVVFGVFYLLLGPTLLIGWLFEPHLAMQEALNEVLQPLADEFKAKVFADQPTEDESADDIKKGTDRLDQLKRRYTLLQDTFPVWPAQIREIRRFIATISLPAIVTFLLSLPDTYKRIYEFVVNVFHISH